MDKQREKLIELIEEAENICQNKDPVECATCEYARKPYPCTNGLVADHLLANGVVVPPCKVGDKVYALLFDDIPEEHWVIDELTVTEVGTKGVWVSGTYPAGDDMDMFISLAEFGEEVFLSREDAEKALEGVKNDEL